MVLEFRKAWRREDAAPFFICPEQYSPFSNGVKKASTLSTPSTPSTMLIMRYLYILHTFYKPSTKFYKMPFLLKPSTNYFIFYIISTIVEAL